MKKLGVGSVLALAFGLAMLLSAASAEAQMLCFSCDCEDSCATVCRDGPLVPDCPECNLSTCGASGPACGGCNGICELTSICTNEINGNSSGNTLFGTSQHDCINGKGGNDTIDGEAGDDTIHGDDGNDSIFGDSGNDCLLGDAGDDNLQGDSGTDEADGGTHGSGDTCVAETETACEL